MTNLKHILICPLDWGIGHATRCVPIIKLLLKRGMKISVAASGRPLEFLKTSFPDLTFIDFPGYNIIYPDTGGMTIKMITSSPGILNGIRREHHLLKKIIREHAVDAVISDNRFGCWSKDVNSIYITHQVMIKTPPGLHFLEPCLQRFHRWFMYHYNECWIPDLEGEENLSGELSHLYSPHEHSFYIGPLSRFSNSSKKHPKQAKEEIDLLVMLSGPEPQRTIFEKMITGQLKVLTGKKVLILQGLPGETWDEGGTSQVVMHSHLPDDQIAHLISKARIILCRPGYSTIMDLAALKKNAIVVPTPGQTEQEYLAEYLSSKGYVTSISQENLNISNILDEKTDHWHGFPDLYDQDLLEKRIDALVGQIES